MRTPKSLRTLCAVLCAISLLSGCGTPSPKLEVPTEREVVYTYQPCPEPSPVDYPSFAEGEYSFSPKNKEIVLSIIRLLASERDAWKRMAKCYKAQEGKPLQPTKVAE